jgi:hypothetical protein
MARLSDGHDAREVERYLRGLPFPALKHDVVLTARHNGPANDVVGMLESLPVTEFASLEEVIRAYGEEP